MNPGSLVPQSYPLQRPPACLEIKTPLWQLDCAVGLLKQHFGTPDRLVLEQSQFLWQGDDNASGLFVGLRDGLNFQTIEKRAAVIVGLSEQTYPKEVIGNLAAVDRYTGNQQLHDVTVGGWEFTCLSKLPREATALATEIKYLLAAFRKPLADTYGFTLLRPEKLGVAQKVKETDVFYTCTLSSSYRIEDNFVLAQLGLPLSALRLDLGGRAGSPAL